MIVFFYGFWVIGVLLLVLDATGRFTISVVAARLLRLAGFAALSLPAVVPLLAVYTHSWQWSGVTFPTIAHAYGALSFVYVTGVLVETRRTRRWLSRIAYIGLLVLAAIPSFVLLPITGPFVGFAGLALARTSNTRPSGAARATLDGLPRGTN
jgi:hypothetical protein